jgi:hypothetical protein
MRCRWDPPYPAGRRDGSDHDASLRASDDERTTVADALARHYAEGRLDATEFTTRLDAAMTATTRGELRGLFHDLPRLLGEPAAPPAPRRRTLAWAFLGALALALIVAAMAAAPGPLVHVPWLVLAAVALVLWRRAGHGQQDQARRARGHRVPPSGLGRGIDL